MARRTFSEVDLAALNQDFGARQHLQSVMAAHSYTSLELDLGIATTTIYRMEQSGFDRRKTPRIPKRKFDEAKRRRTIYWVAREEYQGRYDYPALMARHNISKPTLLARQRAFRRQSAPMRNAA